MEREQQPVLIIGEFRIDLLRYDIALAGELRPLIGNLYRLAFLVFSFVRDPVSLRAPFPRARNLATGSVHIKGVADGLNLSEQIKAVGLGDLFGIRGALLRLGLCLRSKQARREQRSRQNGYHSSHHLLLSVMEWCRHPAGRATPKILMNQR